jgi:hypothetical protein
VLCHTGAMDLMGTVWEPLIIHPLADIHPMGTVWEPLIIHPLVDIHPLAGHSMVMALSSGPAVEGFHGVEAVAGYSVAGEGSVVGGNSMGTSMEPVGIGHPIPMSPRRK